MSFQGDVAGIGLGELLQGLTRGGRDGVLTLDGEGGLSCFLGMQGAQIYFLPGPSEDTDTWRERCQRAWADYPEPHLEGKRRAAVAHATRRETLFAMLEQPNLHFRFEPGAMPSTPATPDGAEGAHEQPWGPGYSVEFLLLDHARIQDESGSSLARNLTRGDMPVAVVDGSNDPAGPFLEQCDGASTLEEISDRLGWPVRQTRGIIGEQMKAGHVRVAEAHELLAAAQHELALGRIGRAATRLTRWIDLAPPGPAFFPGEAELLLGEWRAERLIPALNVMPLRRARAVLKRLDLASPDREDSLVRWRALGECNKRDAMISFKCAVLSAHETPSEESEPVATELLHIARGLQDKGLSWRARPVLRVAATQVFAKLQTRTELGMRMIQVGLVEDAAGWILDAARDYLANGEAQKAIPPLRALVAADPTNAEASGLLIEARAHKINVRRKRRNSLIALASLLVVSGVALVKVSAQREYDRRLSEISAHLTNPSTALTLMDQYFPGDDSPRVVALRASLEEQRKNTLRAQRDEWLAMFESIEKELEEGDPLVGLQRTIGLDAPPREGTGDWPTRQDLLGILAKRLESSFESLDFDIDATPAMSARERTLTTLLADVLALSDGHVELEGIENFRFFAGELEDRIRDAQARRAKARVERETAQLEQQQDRMLAAARSHSASGELDHAVAMYDRLFSLPGSAELRPLLANEVSAVRAHAEAVRRALELARIGGHVAARKALEGVCKDLSEHLLPWRVESIPTGARATFQDSVRVTPFVMYSGFGQPVSLELEMDGCEDRAIRIQDPHDLVVNMYRVPERTWSTGRRVDAAPVPVGEDHIVADRTGSIARLRADSSVRWSVRLGRTLGGVARTPVFLPRRPGYLLVLCEEGDAWFLRASDGALEGPHRFGSPPTEGPVTTRSGVTARFADGRIALWDDRPEPSVFEDEGMFQSPELVSDSSGEGPANLVVLRRSASTELVLRAPWYDWSVRVHDQHFEVRRGGAFPDAFTVRRDGTWSFVAWEAPNALVPDGRLWVSDESGLRSFRTADTP